MSDLAHERARVLLETLRERGIRPLTSDPQEQVRDASHEAAHALMWGVETPWSRQRIHEKAPAMPRALADEIRVRAVERLVCERIGLPMSRYDQTSAAFSCALESSRMGACPDFNELLRAIDTQVDDLQTYAIVEKILLMLPDELRPDLRPR